MVVPSRKSCSFTCRLQYEIKIKENNNIIISNNDPPSVTEYNVNKFFLLIFLLIFHKIDIDIFILIYLYQYDDDE